MITKKLVKSESCYYYCTIIFIIIIIIIITSIIIIAITTEIRQTTKKTTIDKQIKYYKNYWLNVTKKFTIPKTKQLI